MKLYGYTRTALDQPISEAQQQAVLRDYAQRLGCDLVLYGDTASGTLPPGPERPGLAALFAELKPGDLVVVASIDRLARSLAVLKEIAVHLDEAGATLYVILYVAVRD